MRLQELVQKEPKKQQKPLSYQEELEKKLRESLEKKEVKFTPLQIAAMEGGHSIP